MLMSTTTACVHILGWAAAPARRWAGTRGRAASSVQAGGGRLPAPAADLARRRGAVSRCRPPPGRSPWWFSRAPKPVPVIGCALALAMGGGPRLEDDGLSINWHSDAQRAVLAATALGAATVLPLALVLFRGVALRWYLEGVRFGVISLESTLRSRTVLACYRCCTPTKRSGRATRGRRGG